MHCAKQRLDNKLKQKQQRPTPPPPPPSPPTPQQQLKAKLSNRLNYKDWLDVKDKKLRAPILTHLNENYGAVTLQPKNKTNVATFFHLSGRSWESKGMAWLNEKSLKDMQAGDVQTIEEMEADQNQIETEKRELTAEYERLRDLYTSMDTARKEREEAAKTTVECSEEQDVKTKQMLEKALLDKYDNDIMVKKTKRAISEACCQETWEEQLRQRHIQQKLQEAHELEIERKNQEFRDSKYASVVNEDKRKEEDKLKYQDGIRKQIFANKQMQYLYDDLAQEEGKMMTEMTIQYMENEKKEKQASRDKKTNYFQDLHKTIQMTETFKRLMYEQELNDEKRALSYKELLEQRRKEERDKKARKETAMSQKRELLFARQKKMQDNAEKLEQLRLMADREVLDRRYRDKEFDEAYKRKKLITDLREYQERQIQHNAQIKTQCLHEAEQEYKMLRSVEATKKAKEDAEARHRKMQKCMLRNAIAAQIDTREMERRRKRDEDRLIDLKKREHDDQRKKDVAKVVQMKLDAVRKKACLPKLRMNALEGRVKTMQQQHRV